MCALSDFFVRIERYAYVAVLDVGVLDEVVDCGDDFGNACLVVSSEESVAVGYDEILSNVVEKLGELSGAECYSGRGVKDNVATVIFLYDPRAYMLAAEIGRCVEVSDKSDCRDFLVGVAFECGHEITVVIKGYVG